MKRTLAIDPGLRECGVAQFNDNELSRAALVRNPNKTDRGPYAWRDMARAVRDWYYTKNRASLELEVLVVETQQIYTARFQKGNQDDLLQLAGVNGALSFAFRDAPEAYAYLPRIWKGQVPQAIFANRVMAKLSDAEKAVVEPCPASLLHNVAHGIGLGQYHLKRGAQ